jgi:hypothetical protein
MTDRNTSADKGRKPLETRAREERPEPDATWTGYASDQGEPGDTGELHPRLADEPDEDERVKREVCDRLGAEPGLDAPDIAVDVERGEVVLQGSVGSEDVRRRAESIARGAAGVRGVRNRLEIRAGEVPPHEERRPPR